MTEITEVETQMQLVISGNVDTMRCAVFDNPQAFAPFLMDPDQWVRMGCPKYVRVRVRPVYANGQPWHREQG